MGSETEPQNIPPHNFYPSKNPKNIINTNNNIINPEIPKESEKLNPMRRHSNYHESDYNNNLHSSLKTLNYSKTFSGDQNESNKKFQRGQTRKLSEKYLENFKKSYLEGENKYNFLNHLADSLTYGKMIPEEELEKFKKEYLPKYLLDWKIYEDPNTGVKYWQNHGKIPSANVETILNQMDENTISPNQPFYLKRCWFYRYLTKNFFKNKNINPTITINRQNIFVDSYNQFQKIKSINLARPLNIRFFNEKNEDEGGNFRDWYQSIFKDMVNPNKKLFRVNPNKSLEPFNIMIHPKYPGIKLEYYEFIGKLMIKAIIDMIIIRNFIFNKLHLKLIANKQIDLNDMRYFNLDLYQKLKYINDSKIAGNKQLESIRFVWNIINQNSQPQEIELVPGGKNIFLNDQNKNLFINKALYVEAVMPYEEQIKYIQKGLFQILGEGVQGVFSVEEMNYILAGQENIDLNDLRENIIYKGEFNESHPVIKMFWEKILTLNKNELITLLQFATGSSAVPIDGFGSLKEFGGKIQKLTIEPFMNFSAENPDEYKFHKIESKKQHNTIVLPIYRTKKELDDAINMIVLNKV